MPVACWLRICCICNCNFSCSWSDRLSQEAPPRVARAGGAPAPSWLPGITSGAANVCCESRLPLCELLALPGGWICTPATRFKYSLYFCSKQSLRCIACLQCALLKRLSHPCTKSSAAVLQTEILAIIAYLQMTGHILSCKSFHVHEIQNSLWHSLCSSLYFP